MHNKTIEDTMDEIAEDWIKETDIQPFIKELAKDINNLKTILMSVYIVGMETGMQLNQLINTPTNKQKPN